MSAKTEILGNTNSREKNKNKNKEVIVLKSNIFPNEAFDEVINSSFSF